MQLELHFTPLSVNDAQMRGKIAVAVDVLRASTSICTAIKNGCRDIIPVSSLGDAAALKGRLDPESILMCAEREGLKIDGFDLGNSPFEYTEAVVKDKTLVFASTNGSRAILSCQTADLCLVAGFVNLSMVIEEIIVQKRDVAIVCAGKLGSFALEDALCGGMILDRLLASGPLALQNDSARVAHLLYKKYAMRLADEIRQADHALYLESLGFGRDLEYATTMDCCPVIPRLKRGRIVGSNDDNQ